MCWLKLKLISRKVYYVSEWIYGLNSFLFRVGDTVVLLQRFIYATSVDQKSTLWSTHLFYLFIFEKCCPELERLPWYSLETVPINKHYFIPKFRILLVWKKWKKMKRPHFWKKLFFQPPIGFYRNDLKPNFFYQNYRLAL